MHGTARHPWQATLGVAALLTISFYVLSWINVPLFFDEAAFRRYFGRAFIDGFVQYSFFPVCTEGKAVPLVFIPPHALLSWIDSLSHWSGVRAIPIMSLVALVGVSTLIIRQQSAAWGYGLAIICGGFVGLGGVGLVLSRWEYIATLHITICLITWLIARLRSSSKLVVAVMLALHLGTALLSLFVHPQGLLIMPLSFLSCMHLLRGRRCMSAVVAFVVVGLSFQAAANAGFRCPQDAALESIVQKTQGVAFSSQIAAYSWPERLSRRLQHFEKQFFFQSHEQFSIPVPPLPRPVALLTMAPIALIVSIQLIGIGMGALLAFNLLWRDFHAYFIARHWTGVFSLIYDGRALWLTGTLMLLIYSTIDAGGIFYRAHYRNLLSAVLLGIGVSYLLQIRDQVWFRTWAIFSIFVSAMSTITAWIFLAPQLTNGYESYYVSLQRDWRMYNDRVRSTAGKCGITSGTVRVAVDVATYDALREYPRLVDFNYVWYGDYLKGEMNPNRTEHEWVRYYKKFGISGYVAMCRTLDSARLPIQYRDGDLCCSKF